MFIAFTVTGFFAGIAGALYALFNNFVSPSTVQLSQSVEGLLMAIIGGVGTLFGAFIGASAIYFVFGFLPTLFGFALGLLLQGLVFDPQDLVHLGVNSLSLMLPLIAAHGLFGRRLFDSQSRRLDWQSVVRFDAVYYGGVVAMVGFWLAIGEEPLALDNWLLFAAAYAPLVLCEPLFTCLVVRLLKRWPDSAVLQRLTCVGNLRVA